MTQKQSEANENFNKVKNEVYSSINYSRNKTLEIRKSIEESKAVEMFDDGNVSYLKSNNQDNSKIMNIIQENISYTDDKNKNKYWDVIMEIISSIKKTDIDYPLPELLFGNSLTDLEFLDLFRKAINYVSFSYEETTLNNLKNILINIEDYTNNIFLYPQIMKNIKEDGLLSLIMAKTNDDIAESLELIKIDICTFTPLIKLEFKRQNKDMILDKNELKNILISNVLLNFFMDNLINFIPKFNDKIKNHNDLKKYIISHIDNKNIYFCNLPERLMSVTIFNGDIYMKSKYLKEYFENNNNPQIKKEDNLIIIREKIVLNIKHEMNHILLRQIDEEKKKNFYLKSEYLNSKDKMLIFRNKFTGENDYECSIHESGNSFDFQFYKGFHFDNLLAKEANFFLEVKNMKDKNEYFLKFDEMILNTQKNRQLITDSINKFKRGKYQRPECFKSACLHGDLK